jgi:hypothetical protein
MRDGCRAGADYFRRAEHDFASAITDFRPAQGTSRGTARIAPARDLARHSRRQVQTDDFSVPAADFPHHFTVWRIPGLMRRGKLFAPVFIRTSQLACRD